MTKTIYVYTEQETSPRFFQVVSAIKKSSGLEDFKLRTPYYREMSRGLPDNASVVVFGKISDPRFPVTQPIISTYSPAQVLTKANAVTVVGSALTRAAGMVTETQQEPKDIIYLSSLSKAKESLETLASHARVYAVDIEVSGNIMAGTPEDEDVKILTVAIYDPVDDVSYVVYGEYFMGSGVNRLLREFFSNTNSKFLYHNGKFDVRVLNRRLGMRVPVHQDTMLMHHVLNQAAGMHGLKQLCKLYLGAEEWEQGLEKYTKKGGHYENIPVEMLAKYNALDVYWTYKLFMYLKPQLEADENYQRAYQLELEAAAFLLKVEERGIPIDTEALEDLDTSSSAQSQLARHRLQQLVGDPKFNPGSPKQVKEFLQNQGHFVSSTGAQALADLKEYLAEGDEVDGDTYHFIELLLEFRKYNKVNSTYVKGWGNKMRNGLVHPTFLVHGTSTGRLSSTSPNAQNMPRSKEVRAIVGV